MHFKQTDNRFSALNWSLVSFLIWPSYFKYANIYICHCGFQYIWFFSAFRGWQKSNVVTIYMVPMCFLLKRIKTWEVDDLYRKLYVNLHIYICRWKDFGYPKVDKLVLKSSFFEVLTPKRVFQILFHLLVYQVKSF